MVYLLDNEVPCAAGKGMWGDYAHVLWAGFASQDESGVGYVERTGPFVPDAYLASNSLICTERVKDNIVSNTLGLLFVPQEKRKIVRVEWRSWDPARDIFHYIDRGDINEPEDLVEAGLHDPVARDLMPSLWKLDEATLPELEIKKIGKYDPRRPVSHLAVVKNSVPSRCFFAKSRNFLGVFAGEEARCFLEKNYPGFFGYSCIPFCD